MKRYAVLLTAATGDRRLVGPWRDRARADEVADRLQAVVDHCDPDCELDVSVGLLELEGFGELGLRRLAAWALDVDVAAAAAALREVTS